MLRRCAGLFLAASLVTAPAFAEIGRVKRAYPDAFIVRAGVQKPAGMGDQLLEHDTLKTGPGGRITVAFIDNTRFSIGPMSVVSIDQFKFDETKHEGGRFVTRIDRGALAVVSGDIAHESKDAMRVRTPTSLLGVRGTRFVVAVK